jgi:glycerol kinase
MQFQADILDCPVVRPSVQETTALGAAYLAGLAVGYWRDRAEIASQWKVDRRFEPAMKPDRREKLRHDWTKALERAKKWEDPA